MDSNDLEVFFSRSFEEGINERLFFYNYVLEKDKVLDYIHRLDAIPFSEFLDFVIKNGYRGEITSAEVIQFSSFNDCTSSICQKMEEAGDKGMNYDQVGALLLNDGVERNKNALIKYGENHAKASSILGLTQCKDRYYFLSCLGYVFNGLSDGEKGLLISRLSLRDKLVQKTISLANNGPIDLKDELNFLSPTTFVRRRCNILKLFRNVYDHSNPSFFALFNNITIDGSHLF
jgi:hypothetical protein